MAWAPDYVTLAAQRLYVRLQPVADEYDDVEISEAVSGASRAIDLECCRQFGNSGATESREYTPRWSKSRQCWYVDTDDIPTSVGLTMTLDTAHDGTFATAVTKLLYRPLNVFKRLRPAERLLFTAPAGAMVTGAADEVRVTVPSPGFGWAAVPTTIILATKMQANRFLIRRDSPYGIAGNPDQGSELRLLARVDPDVALMINAYRRRVGVR
jgi:hypothetical protein